MDKKIVKRLLGYAKPYIAYIMISIILLAGITITELLQPKIIGDAIDDVINAYHKTYTQDPNGEIVLSNGLVLSRGKDKEGQSFAQLIYENNSYFLIYDLSENDLVESDFSESDLSNNSYQKSKMSAKDLELLRKNDLDQLKWFGLIFLLIIAFNLVFNYFQKYILQFTGQKIIFNIRKECYEHLQKLSMDYFHHNPVGKVVTRITNDTEVLNEMYTSVIVNSLKNIFMLLGIVIIMLWMNVRLALTIFTVIPLIIILTGIFRVYSRKAYREVRTRLTKINTFLSEHISGIKTVQVFAKEKEIYERFEDTNKAHMKANIRQIIIFGIYRPSMYVMQILGLCIVVYFGGKDVIDGKISIGLLAIYIQYVTMFFQPIQQLAEQFNIFQSAMAAAEKIFTLLDDKRMINECENPISMPNMKGDIEFKNVWFAYDDENYVLRDVSFSVKQGETVAFVGATGAGKTSILNLISRYYDIQKGEILIDGVNIKDLDIKALRGEIGQMLQDVFIFTGDIKNNISLRSPIELDEIRKAAKFVNAHEFIKDLPAGYDEPVYEKGSTLSTGQKQLLSFARTLVHKPSVLILDEATSNIDTETEVLIQNALEKLMKNRTTLVVAHRLSTIQHADKIVVMHKGKIREIGNHQSLLEQKGIYYNLYKLQYD